MRRKKEKAKATEGEREAGERVPRQDDDEEKRRRTDRYLNADRNPFRKGRVGGSPQKAARAQCLVIVVFVMYVKPLSEDTRTKRTRTTKGNQSQLLRRDTLIEEALFAN